MDVDDYDTFRGGPHFRVYIGKTLDNIHTVTNATTPLRVRTGGATGTNSKTLTPVQEFDKGMKRDVSAFPVLKDERFWDDFL